MNSDKKGDLEPNEISEDKRYDLRPLKLEKFIGQERNSLRQELTTSVSLTSFLQ